MELDKERERVTIDSHTDRQTDRQRAREAVSERGGRGRERESVCVYVCGKVQTD